MNPDPALFCWLLGIGIAHALRWIVFPQDPINRKVIAAAGFVIYTVGAILAAVALVWAQAIAVVFPLVGVAAVLLTKSKIDNWQLAVGITQFAAITYVLYCWAEGLWT